MTGFTTVWIVVGLACVAANLPFLFERVLFIWLHPSGRKGFGWRFLELLALYLVVGGLAFLLENNAHGAVYPKGWQFYAATFCLFLVFAFPGFVHCYLWRGNRRRHAVVEIPHDQE
ncbi:MAG: DUF2818 family protein [Betaproteobacteria bacterium]|nr:DUF2818 family protein [Betaproteobacteria bacterium]MCL2162284.1 DUF2818 family protein [Betaproteobacteria bacterium]